ncbi:MAG: hypothetical protein GEU78_17705 [Actinobacteria bacterium]|nr:hypothetical protein [Actinomycetota bacterium]
MSAYQLLASECPPGPDCPKVCRGAPGKVAIVGTVITDHEVLATLWAGRTSAGMVVIIGPRITNPEALLELTVDAGEAALEITDAAYLALAAGSHEGVGPGQVAVQISETLYGIGVEALTSRETAA